MSLRTRLDVETASQSSILAIQPRNPSEDCPSGPTSFGKAMSRIDPVEHDNNTGQALPLISITLWRPGEIHGLAACMAPPWSGVRSFGSPLQLRTCPSPVHSQSGGWSTQVGALRYAGSCTVPNLTGPWLRAVHDIVHRPSKGHPVRFRMRAGVSRISPARFRNRFRQIPPPHIPCVEFTHRGAIHLVH